MNTSPPFLPAPTPLALEPDEVHVWRARLNGCAAELDDLEGLLSPDERTRADRFHFPGDREQFIVARGTLRRLLSRYLGTPPERLSFRTTPYGKPFLTPEAGGDTLRFNLSHAGGLALYAVSLGRELGIDIEAIRPQIVQESVAERFFASSEVTALRSLPAAQQPEAFFACWTRKEAYIKAKGMGLSIPLESFEVSLLPGEPCALRRTAEDPEDAARWSLTAIDAGAGYAAAMAVEGHGCRVRCWEWTG